MFFKSQSKPEQDHIVAALVFELSKVETVAIRERVVGQIVNIDTRLADRVANGLGMAKTPAAIAPAMQPHDMKPSPALSIIAKQKGALEGRVVAYLVTDGVNEADVTALRSAVEAAGAQLKIVAPKVGGVKTKAGKQMPADMQLAGAPSVLFDAVALLVSDAGVKALLRDSAAKGFVADAYAHLKFIGHNAAAAPLL